MGRPAAGAGGCHCWSRRVPAVAVAAAGGDAAGAINGGRPLGAQEFRVVRKVRAEMAIWKDAGGR